MKLNNSKGFSLVELMVVVAIAGLLAIVGIPSYTKFTAKAREAEAKASLGAMFTAQAAFHAEHSTYHTSFQAIGFSPFGQVRYNIGFGDQGGPYPATLVLASNVNVLAINSGHYCGGFGMNVPGNECRLVSIPVEMPHALLANETSFLAGAYASETDLASHNVPNSRRPGYGPTAHILLMLLAPQSAHALATKVPARGQMSIWTMNQNKILRKDGPYWN